ncbi:MAG: hypothetical protein HY898_17270 [Deltaproteobacteria bacterium]|nr:hypothetical protein [Deltaproteobacteria bacterium]
MMQPTPMQPWQVQPPPGDDQDPPGSVDYPPAMRAAPLGWHFSLIFLIHSVMPLGLAFLPFWVLKETWAGPVFLAAGAVISALIMALLIKSAVVARSKQNSFVQAWHYGRRAQAQLLDLELLVSSPSSRSGSVRRSYRKVRLQLAVYLPGAAPYQTDVECYFRTPEVSYLVPGAVLQVAVHPTDPSIVLVAPLVRGH